MLDLITSIYLAAEATRYLHWYLLTCFLELILECRINGYYILFGVISTV